eukprot:29705_1
MSQHEKQNKTVFGYCNSLKPTIRLPSDVIKLCFAFYALPDEWDTNKKSGKINIYDHGKYQNILARYPQQRKKYSLHLATTFGLKICKPDSGIHQWILRLVESNNAHSNYSVVIGIVKDEFIDECINENKNFKHPGGTNANQRMPVAFMRFNNIDRGYGLVANRACKMIKYDKNNHELARYGERFRDLNDIMRVILDMDKGILSFIINGNDYGKAFDIDKNYEYRLAVCMLPGITIEMCDMEEERSECKQITKDMFKNDVSERFTWKYMIIAIVVVLVSIGFAFYPFQDYAN